MKKTTLDRKIILIIFLGCQLAFGQSTIINSTEKGYERWHTLEEENVAPNGKWITFVVRYENGNDTLVVKESKGKKQFVFPNSVNGQFSSDSKWFTFLNSTNQLLVFNLEKCTKEAFKEVKKYQIDQLAKNIAIRTNNDTLMIMQLKTKKLLHIPKVKEFEFSPKGDLVVLKETSVVLFAADNPFLEIPVATNIYGFKNVVWNQNKGFAFLENLEVIASTNQNHKIGYYDLATKKYYTIQANDFPELKGKSIVKPFGQKGIVLELHEDKVFFYFNNREKAKKEELKMEVWEYDSPLEYPSQITEGDFEKKDKLAVWWPQKNKISLLGSKDKPKTVFCPDSNYIISFNPLDYEPQYELSGPVDVYLTDLNSNESTLLLKKQAQKVQTFGASSQGNYLHYYRDQNWWVYDIKKKRHTNITKKLPYPVENFKNDEAGPKYGFGCAGWSSDNKHIFIYDEYDIWKISPDGKEKVRITNGRDSSTVFRIEEDLYVNKCYRGSVEFLTYTFDKKEGIIIVALDKNKNWGYYRWTEKEGINKIIHNNSKSSRIKTTAKSQEMIWIEEDVTTPPRVVFKSKKDIKSKVVYQSNKHYTEFGLRKAALIQYKNSKGVSLNGVLYYPIGYDETKKYPMITFIYEKLSQRLHQYENPTLYNPGGFNIANYMQDGYFVLFPDIVYEVGNPGLSAKDCVESAVNEVLKMNRVDKNRIGIYGHSFGGYQVASIITQTDIFKAAVMGSGITDLNNLYVQMNWSWSRTQAWRFESQQMRMGSNPFENSEGYKNNSPIANAARVNTPVLIYTGKEDYNVDWNQSIYFHMALRRLKKINKLLLFPKEGHTINTQENQVVLTHEIKKWFDFYLKE
ncbi:alpha/beta hydrolase family protein [Flavobacterium ardleyense]|uniref:Alpha/beta hydrolase family protein n=1 Tax=Flavobacterium ardleyense TaxID=2038737 RepID=A0ABW5ZA92_9FLAO